MSSKTQKRQAMLASSVFAAALVLSGLLMASPSAFAQPTENVVVTPLSSVSIKMVAKDTDMPAQKLTFNATGLPHWAKMNSATGEIIGRPAETDAGNSTVTVSVNDGHGGTTSLTFVLTVTNVKVNTPPTLSLVVNANTTSAMMGNQTTAAAPPSNQTTAAAPPSNQTTAAAPPSNQTSGATSGNATAPRPSGNVPSKPTLTLSSSSVRAGATVIVSGSGFTPSQTVTVTLGNSGYAVMTHADNAGAFTASMTIPNSIKPATYTITGTDRNAVSATTVLTVIQ
jgi:putative Ig domain-containing protein